MKTLETLSCTWNMWWHGPPHPSRRTTEPTHAQNNHISCEPSPVLYHAHLSSIVTLLMAHAQLVFYILASCVCVPVVVRVLSVVTLTPLFPRTRISHSAFGVAGSTCLLGRQIANNLVAAILPASHRTTTVSV